MTMDKFQDAQIDEMHKRLDAEHAGVYDEGDDQDDAKESQETPDSQMTGTGSQVTDSQRTETQRNDLQTTVTGSRAVSVAASQRTVTGHLDDGEPLPDIVRYKFADKDKKDKKDV